MTNGSSQGLADIRRFFFFMVNWNAKEKYLVESLNTELIEGLIFQKECLPEAQTKSGTAYCLRCF